MTTTLEQAQTLDIEGQGFIEQLKKPSTKKTYTIALIEFQNYLSTNKSMTLDEWVKEVDADHERRIDTATNIASKSLKDFAKKLQERNLSSNTVSLYVAAVLSYFFYRVDGRYKLTSKFAGLPKPEVQSDKEQWTLELISEFFLSMDKPIYRLLVVFILQSGLSLEDVLSLKYSDIREEFEKGVVPLSLELKRKKTGVPFHTFLGKLAVTQLREYFAIIGTPRPEQPIFHGETNPAKPDADMKPLTKASIERYFARRAKRFLKKEWVGENPRRPHSIRAAFQKLLVLAGCAEIFAEYFMGHEVSKNKAAYIIKGMSLEQFREVYSRFEHALTFRIEPLKAASEVKPN